MLVVDVPKVGVGGSLESEDAQEACLLVRTVSLIDIVVGGFVSVVGYADGTSDNGVKECWSVGGHRDRHVAAR